MPIWDALTAATVEAGVFLNRPNDLSMGSAANLLILNADPTVNIKNLEKIESVFLRGKHRIF
jgi:imidazolonepropionase-like amidohydrolase